jgi:hypothetical protein
MYDGKIEDDIWLYLQQMHSNSTTYVKWNGKVTEDCISEGKGNRQGGISSADEWKVYNNEMIKDIEGACTDSDMVSNLPTNCVAVADDVAPTVTGDTPREALHQLQILLNIVEAHGEQLYMSFGVDKCKLLISGRQKKIKAMETLLGAEPHLLTFYGKPVSTVENFYVHIGVPQATRQQSQVAAKYRISKGNDISYKLQESTKNSLLGISPIASRKMFLCYHQPSFIYGLDTLSLNKADIDSLERNYRRIIKKFMCLPENTPSTTVYLTFGVLPFEAQRDLEILGLLGQISVCPSDQQSVKDVIMYNLMFYGNKLKGWSTLVRQICHKYDLPDPLDYMCNPWRADRWRSHCNQVIHTYWVNKLRSEAAELDSLQYLDLESLNLDTTMNVWRRAGLNSEQSRKATVVSWMILGVFKTREKLAKMKQIKSDKCLACGTDEIENLPHLLLYCSFYAKIRDEYLPKLAVMNPSISSILNNETKLIISVLDPESNLLPPETRLYSDEAFKVSRSFCFDLYKKREKFYELNQSTKIP